MRDKNNFEFAVSRCCLSKIFYITKPKYLQAISKNTAFNDLSDQQVTQFPSSMPTQVGYLKIISQTNN